MEVISIQGLKHFTVSWGGGGGEWRRFFVVVVKNGTSTEAELSSSYIATQA